MIRKRIGILLSMTALAALLGACSGDSGGNSPQAGTAPVVARTASQQGTAGGLADYDGDGVDDLFVGAPYALASTGQIGAVFVYRADATTATGFSDEPAWTLTGDDNFGYRFANVGDVNGDGFSEFAVTALNGDSETASLCGSVTVYQGGSSGQVLKRLGGEQALDKFGYSLTGNCDLNADGHLDLVVGAIGHSPTPETYLGGADYVYFGPDLATRVKLPATGNAGILGFSSACGDINNDSVDDLVISAIWTHGVHWHSSQVLAYYGGVGFAPATDEADVTIDSSASHFGDGLAVIGDLDGDGFREIAIGVPSFYVIPFPMDHHKGTVHVVKGGEGTRTVDLNLRPPPEDLLTTVYGAVHQERFGSTVLALDDLDGDGVEEFAVSALHANADTDTGPAASLSSGQVTGKVYIFSGADVQIDGTATQAAVATGLSRAERDLHYGTFLAAFDQEGTAKLLVGAPTAERLTGTVYVETLPDGQ